MDHRTCFEDKRPTVESQCDKSRNACEKCTVTPVTRDCPARDADWVVQQRTTAALEKLFASISIDDEITWCQMSELEKQFAGASIDDASSDADNVSYARSSGIDRSALLTLAKIVKPEAHELGILSRIYRHDPALVSKGVRIVGVDPIHTVVETECGSRLNLLQYAMYNQELDPNDGMLLRLSERAAEKCYRALYTLRHGIENEIRDIAALYHTLDVANLVKPHIDKLVER